LCKYTIKIMLELFFGKENVHHLYSRDDLFGTINKIRCLKQMENISLILSSKNQITTISVSPIYL